MNEFEKNMEDIFDIDVAPIEKTTEMITQANSEITIDATKDYEYTRAELYTLISKGQEAVQGRLRLLRSQGTPERMKSL